MDTYTAIGWSLGFQQKVSQYLVIEDFVFNIEQNAGSRSQVYLACGADADAAHEYAVELTHIDENAGLKLKGGVRAAEVTLDLDALAAIYLGGPNPLGADLSGVLAAVTNGTVVQ